MRKVHVKTIRSSKVCIPKFTNYKTSACDNFLDLYIVFFGLPGFVLHFCFEPATSKKKENLDLDCTGRSR